HEIEDVFRGYTEIRYGSGIRVLDTTSSSRLTLEAFNRRGVCEILAMQEFDCHRALHEYVSRSVDRSHSAFANLAFYPVFALEKSANKSIYRFWLEQSASRILQGVGMIIFCS